MHEELEQMIKNKKVTSPSHRGEQSISSSRTAVETSLVRDLVNAPVPGSIAFSFIAFVAISLVSLTFQIGPEQDIEVAISQNFVATTHRIDGAVLGISSGVARADITANGQNSATVAPGESVRLAWNSVNANNCIVNPLGVKGISGDGLTGELSDSQTYTLVCETDNGVTVADEVAVTVGKKPTLQKRK